MKRYSISGHARITKQAAHKLWNVGLPFYICASNLQPFGGWNHAMFVDPSRYAGETTFRSTGDPADKEDYYAKGSRVPYDLQDLVDNFVSYNCTCAETGRYVAFYACTESEMDAYKDEHGLLGVSA